MNNHDSKPNMTVSVAIAASRKKSVLQVPFTDGMTLQSLLADLRSSYSGGKNLFLQQEFKHQHFCQTVLPMTETHAVLKASYGTSNGYFIWNGTKVVMDCRSGGGSALSFIEQEDKFWTNKVMHLLQHPLNAFHLYQGIDLVQKPDIFWVHVAYKGRFMAFCLPKTPGPKRPKQRRREGDRENFRELESDLVKDLLPEVRLSQCHVPVCLCFSFLCSF